MVSFFGTLVPTVEAGPPFADTQKQLADLLLQYPALQITYRRIPFLESEFDQYVTYELPPRLCFQMFATKGSEIMIQVLRPHKRLYYMQYAKDVRAFRKLVTTAVPPPTAQFSYASLAAMPRKPSSEEDDEDEKKDSSLAIDEAASLTARPDVLGLSTEHVALHGMNKILWDQYLWPFFQSQGHHLQAFARERDSRALQQQWNVCTLTNPQYVTSDAARMAQIFKFYHISPTQVKVHVKGSTLLFLNISDCVACLQMIWDGRLKPRNFL